VPAAPERRGQVFAFVFGMTALVVAAVLLFDDKGIGGLAAILAAVGTIVVAFLAGRSDSG
jgi:uncharacterized membrane protein YdjX (TVP38/TMEM64 family)